MAAAEPPSLPNASQTAKEGVPVQAAAPMQVTAAAEPPATRSALRAMPALLEKPAQSAQLAKPVPVKAVVRPSPPRRAKSLDDLLAQIMTSR